MPRTARFGRAYYSAYPETPSGKIYGESANAEGKAAFEARLGKRFELGVVMNGGAVASERSPYGIPLDVAYPLADVQAVFAGAAAAMPAWIDAGADARTGVMLEMLTRLNRASFEVAYATMHTTGQAFVLAFQAGGPHAQDRALEAVAYAYDEMSRVPAGVMWEKPQGKNEPMRIEKTYCIVPRGISLAIGCSTFPTWNSYPGILTDAAFVANRFRVIETRRPARA